MTIIISLGGSLIVPDKVDIKFLKRFREAILSHIRKEKVVIYCGGGATARQYQKAAAKVRKLDNTALDWLGISATALNAFLMRVIFHEYSEAEIVTNPTKKINLKKKILLCAGWKPGWSTDYDAVLLAKNLKVKKIINMTNIDYVYNKDPKKHRNAKPIKQISWKDFRKIVGNKWKAGLNMPFDPVAAKQAQKQKLTVCILGKDIKNLKNCLSNKKFKGTIIR